MAIESLADPIRVHSAEKRIAVLMACFNRRETTLACLAALHRQPEAASCDVYLVDDGSSDGTAAAVRAAYPHTRIVAGTGSLFWNGGMRLAWDSAAASGEPYDVFLWLNDDVTLHDGAIARLLAAAETAGEDAAIIVVGSTCEPHDATVQTYGGHRLPSPKRPLRMNLVPPTDRPIPVDTLSGNIVLVSRRAYETLGNLDPRYVHIYGDLDYGFRARAAGIAILQSAGVAGSCASNSAANTSLDRTLSRYARLRLRLAESRKMHARDWNVFARKHSGLGALSFLYAVAPFVRIVMTPRTLDQTHAKSSGR